MSSATRRLLLAACVLSLLLTGCAAMADPDSSDLPWAQTNEWELAPNIPSSMLNQ